MLGLWLGSKIKEVYAEANADLNALFLSERYLGPRFEPDITSYTAYVHHDMEEIPGWAKRQVAALKNLEIISGKGSNKFAPKDQATRAEAVTIILKVLAQEIK